jgi:hypothetical protein
VDPDPADKATRLVAETSTPERAERSDPAKRERVKRA